MRQRWYDPAGQRFISRDTAFSSNRYSYAFNNPANLVDSNGQWPSPVELEKQYRKYQNPQPQSPAVPLPDRFLPIRNSSIQLRQKALAGGITGLDAMYSIMQQIDQVAETNDEFIDMIQAVFVPNKNCPVGSRQWVSSLKASKLQDETGGWIGPVPGAVFSFPVTGWKNKYIDCISATEDQSHHLVAFIVQGYYDKSGFISALAPSYVDDPAANKGDYDLGEEGIRLGKTLQRSNMTDKAYPYDMTNKNPMSRKTWLKLLYSQVAK